MVKTNFNDEDQPMKRIVTHPISNNAGSATIVALLMLAALSLTVFMAMDTSMMNSSMMRNNRDYRENLYRSESGLTIATENHQNVWLQAASPLFSISAGDAEIIDQDASINDADGNPVRVAQYDIARVEDYTDGTIDSKLAEESLTRDFFPLPHFGPPVIGTGMSARNFEIRRYGIHTRAVDKRDNVTSLTIESGLWKIFNKAGRTPGAASAPGS